MAAAPEAAAGAGGDDTWKLYYWPVCKGRGEYVRLCFEEAGVPYVDVGFAANNTTAAALKETKDWGAIVGSPGFKAIVDFCFTHGTDGAHAPVRAPPAIEKGGFVICNTPAILSYLNDAFGWGAGLMREQKAAVDQILSVILSDAVGEGRLAFHPKDFYASHKTQVEESKPYIKQYGEQRLPKYISFLEAQLAWNNELRPGAAGGGFLVGPSLTAADLCAYHFACAAEHHYGQWFGPLIEKAPRLAALKAAVAARPKVAAYLASDRCPPWDADSMM